MHTSAEYVLWNSGHTVPPLTEATHTTKCGQAAPRTHGPGVKWAHWQQHDGQEGWTRWAGVDVCVMWTPRNKIHYWIQGQEKLPEVWDKNIYQIIARSKKTVPGTRLNQLWNWPSSPDEKGTFHSKPGGSSPITEELVPRARYPCPLHGMKANSRLQEINHLSSWPEFRRDISARGSFLKSWPGLPGNLKYCCSLFLDLFIWIRLPAWALGDACGLQLVHRWLPFIIIIIINKAPASFRSWWKGETHKKVTTLWGMTTENYKHLSCSEVHKTSTLTKATGRGFLERQAWTRNSRCIWGVKMIERCVRGEAWPAQIHEAKKYKWYLETASNKQACHEGKSM